MGADVWLCNLKAEDCKILYNFDNNDFWGQVWHAWCAYNFEMPVDVQDVANQFLWFNSLIRINSRPFCFSRAHRAGIRYVHQLVEPSGQFRSYQDIVSIFGNCLTWLEYHQLCGGIHHQWKRLLHEDSFDMETPCSKYEKLCSNTRWSAIIYNQLVEGDTEILLERKFLRWQRYLKDNFTFNEFLSAFRNIVKCTLSTKLRDFQFRLLHCCIFLNDILFRWGKVDSANCSFCNLCIENYVHFFVTCKYVRAVWQIVQEYLKNNDNTNCFVELDFNAKNIIFNRVHPKPAHVVNLVILVVKQYLFRTRCLGNKPFGQGVIDEIEQIFSLEDFIA